MISIKNNTWVVLEIYSSSFSLEIPLDGEITVSDEEINGDYSIYIKYFR